MKKYTVITAIFGNYDYLREKQFSSEMIEYVCVTDNPNLKSDTWRIIYVGDTIPNNWSPRRKTYYARYHLFDYCDTPNAIWIDGSMELGDISILLTAYESFNYDRAFIRGMEIRRWIYDNPLRFGLLADVSYLHASDRIEQFSNVLYFSNFNAVEYAEHINGRFRLYKNTEENKKLMLYTYNVLVDDLLIHQRHFEFGKPDVFYYDEPIAGIMLYKERLERNTMFINYENLSFNLYKHNSIETRNRYE